MSKKKVLFVHQNFPGQFKSIAPFLAFTKKYDVHTLAWKKSHKKEDYLNSMRDLTHHQYEIRSGSSKNIHPLAIEFETKMIRADTVALKCYELKNTGFNPDLIIDHPGWGETLFIKEVWPDAKLLSFFEFYYNTSKSDIDFDLEEQQVQGYEMSKKLIARNAPINLSYLTSDTIISPTEFQKSTAPSWLQNKINVIHDGIDTDLIKPGKKDASIQIKYKDVSNDKLISTVISRQDKIITFVNRNLEPYRGYHSFMRALPAIQKIHPDAFILIVGGDQVSYGSTHPSGDSYKNIFLNEVKDSLIDKSKLIFLGKVDYNIFLNIMDLSSVHIYLTYPFVLSWSMLEVMALEKVVVGSKTKPVEEVIIDNENGLLVDFFDIEEIANRVISVLSNPEKFNQIRKRARKTIVDHYDLRRVCLPKQLELIERILK